MKAALTKIASSVGSLLTTRESQPTDAETSATAEGTMLDLADFAELRQAAGRADSALGAIAHEKSRVGLMSSAEQRAQMGLAKFDLYSEADTSHEAYASALAACAEDEKAEVAAAEADQRRLDENTASIDEAQQRFTTLQRSLAHRQAARAATDASAAEEEATARADVETAALGGDDDAIAAAQGRFQRVAGGVSDDRRAVRESETVVIEAIERQMAAQGAAIASLQDEARRIGESRAEHLKAAEAAKWDAMVNRFIPVAHAMLESGVRPLPSMELVIPFHDPRRVFAADLIGGKALRFDGLDRLSASQLRAALADAQAVLERAARDIERARDEVAARGPATADENAAGPGPEIHAWERGLTVSIKTPGP